MSHDRSVRSPLLFPLTLLLAASLALSACGSDPEPDDRPDVETDAGPDADVGPDVETDADVDPDEDVGITDPTDPPEGAIACDERMPAPPTGERCVVIPGTSDHILIRGTILAGDEVYHEGSLLLDDQSPNRQITCSGCGCADEPEAQDATIISCPTGVISPGLINPHDHITYSLSRPQPHGEERFDHRHDWRRGMRGHTQINTSPGANNSHEGILYGELRMLFGGATSIVGSVGSGNAAGMLRNLDNVNYTEGLSGVDVLYRTFPLGDTNGTLRASGCDYPSIDSESRLSAGTYLPHISEGIDHEAQNEFHCLSGASGSDLIQSNTAIIHGIGLSARDVALMAQRGSTLVWSARTNIDLYGNTAQVPLFKTFGVPITLGTDWSASGSMNMLRELQCADYLNRLYFDETFTEQELWMMVTANAADAMGAGDQIGRLEQGYIGDITIFDGTSRQPYRAVIDAEIADIVLVMRGGEPLYGDAELIEGLVDGEDLDGCELVDVCERDRRLCVELDAGKSLSDIRSAVSSNAYELFFCGEPDDEPSCMPFRPNEYTGLTDTTDSSGDGIPDAVDNCPAFFNPIRPMDGTTQADTNGNGLGDICDPCPLSEDPNCTEVDPDDLDGDGVANDVDNCPVHFNPGQENTSGDQFGDACSPCPETFLGDGAACPLSIYDLKDGTVAPGARATFEGVIVTAVAEGESFFVQVDPESDDFRGFGHSGIYVFNRGGSIQPQVGDRIDLTGSTSLFFGQVQVASIETIDVLESGYPVPDPVLVNSSDIANNGPLRQALEGVLVRVENVTVTDDAPAAGPGQGSNDFEFVIDGQVRVNNLIYTIDPKPEVGEEFASITGALRWANENSKIEPRSELDVISGPPYLATIEPSPIFVSADAGDLTTVTLTLNRAAEVDTTLALSYAPAGIVTGLSEVIVEAGQQSVDVDLSALSADGEATLTATLDEVTLTAPIFTFDSESPRQLESFSASAQTAFIGDQIRFDVALNIPAGDAGETASINLLPIETTLTYPADATIAAGERSASFTLTFDEGAGDYTVEVSLGGDTLGVPVTIVEPPSELTESFDNFDGPGNTYGTGTFTGDAGFTWSYAGARRVDDSTSSEYAIDGTGLMFGGSNAKSLIAEGIEGGISSIRFDMMKAFTGGSNRQVEVFVNGSSVGTSVVFGSGSGADPTIVEYFVEGINVSGDFDLEIRSIQSGQVTIDNLVWTAYLP